MRDEGWKMEDGRWKMEDGRGRYNEAKKADPVGSALISLGGMDQVRSTD